MEKHQALILFAMIAVMMLIMIATAYFAQTGQKSGIDPGARFVAKPGTTRKNATMLVNAKKPPPTGNSLPANSPAASVPSDKSNTSLKAQFLSKDGSPPQRSPAEKSIQEAAQAPNPEAGIAMLEDALAKAPPPEEQAALHTAIGRLHMQQQPPAPEAALAQFDKALAVIPRLEDRLTVFRESLDVLLKQGADDAALQRIQAMIAASEPQTTPRASLGLMLGQTYEHVNNAAKAEESYRQAWEDAVRTENADPKKTEETLRLIALRLAPLYRASGRTADADRLAKALTDWKEGAAP